MDASGVYTMRDLNQRTADVIKQVNDTGKPAVITRHGHFVALITPLEDIPVESAVLGAVLDVLEQGKSSDTVYSSSEMADAIATKFGLAQTPDDGPPRELFQEGAGPDSYAETLTVTNDREGVAIDVGALSAELDSVTEAAEGLQTPEISKLIRALAVGGQTFEVVERQLDVSGQDVVETPQLEER